MTYMGAGGRAEPRNLEAERGLLGIVLERNDALFDVISLVAKTDFFEAAHGEIFTLMRDQIEQGKTASPTTVLYDTAQDTDIGGIMTSGYLAKLLREAPPVSVARDLARTIRDLAMRRKLIAASQKVMDEAYSAPATITAVEMEARYQAETGALFASLADLGIRSFYEVGDAMLNKIADAARHERPLGIDVGLKALQDLTGALLPGRLYTIAAGAKAGKTGLALQVAQYVAQTEPVLFFSIEMDPEELANRKLAADAGISGEVLERAMINSDNWGDLQTVLKQTKGLKLYLDGMTSPTVGAIRGKIIRTKKRHGCSVVIIDHMLYVARDPKLTEFDGVRQILQGLKKTARELGVAVILLAHFKQSYATLDKVRDPHDGDVYGGGAVSQESDVLVLLHREEQMLQKRRPPADDAKGQQAWDQRMLQVMGKAKLILGQRRSGHGHGERWVSWDENTQRFSDTIRAAAAATVQSAQPALALETEDAPF